MGTVTRLKSVYITLLFCYLSLGSLYAASQSKNILIISSYTPLTRLTATALSEFGHEYKRLSNDNAKIMIESLNCKGIIDIKNWKSALRSILDKYEHDDLSKPSLIILMGQEAWATYLSLKEDERPDIPVISTQVSRNFISIPNNNTNNETWMDKTYDFNEVKHNYPQIKSAFLYNYDIIANLRLALHFYPETKNIIFLSDNTYGGISLQALICKEMKKYPELNLMIQEGRQQTIFSLVDCLKRLPEKSVIFVGTCRIDKNDNYFMPNATYLMVEANSKVPAFTPTTVGLGHWTLGGIIPKYKTNGIDIAKEAYRIIDMKDSCTNIFMAENHFVADYKKTRELGLDLESFEDEAFIINRPPTLYEQYQNKIWIIVGIISVLSVMLLCLIYYYYRLRLLNRHLECSEAELIKAKEAAEESSRMKSSFLANMSHEIRTPLNAIVGFTDVIAEGDLSVESICEYNQIIKTNSMLLVHLINDILDFSRLDSDKVFFKKNECDAIDICKSAISTIDVISENNNKYIFKSDVESFKLRVDALRIQQVLINLQSNANKYTKNGTITLGFEIDRKTNMACFSVTDTGCGIPLEKQKKIFERFEKLNEYDQGTGLGLSISKLIVEKSGGDIWVDPNYTQGAKFIFTIPIDNDLN